MSRDTVADALDRAAEALAQAAHELRGTEPSVARADVPAAGDVPPAPAPAANPGLHPQMECPKHHVAWEPGNFGPYCKQITDDPAWGKAKTDRDGNPVLWCKLTPKNAPDWLKVHGRAAA
jgi:hypothetical protein